MSGSARISDVRAAERNNYPFTLTVLPGEDLRLRFAYHMTHFGVDQVGRLTTPLIAPATRSSQPDGCAYLTDQPDG